MYKSLVIVESPTKARTIGKFLGSEYHVVSSMGHIVDLPKSKLGIDIENDFSPTYVIIPSKRKTLNQLRKLVKDSPQVFIATDPDREIGRAHV